MYILHQTQPTSDDEAYGQLPAACTSAVHTLFYATGTDYFWPINVGVRLSSVKRWGFIFTCLARRAVQFELAHTLNTDIFSGAFSRFTSRRRTLHTVYTDNGDNLTAGERELREIMEKD